PELLPLAERGHVSEVNRWFDATAASTPAVRARGVKEAIDAAESGSLTAAGIYATNQSVFAILNSRGLFDYHRETLAQFSITTMAGDSSGWAKSSACDAAALETLGLARRAVEKAARSERPR